MTDHFTHNLVSLELARRIADGLPRHPEWIDLARSNLRRWSERNRDAPGLIRCYGEWTAILELPIDDIRTVLTAETDEAQRLRQNSPFVGILPPAEIWDTKRRHATKTA